MHIARVHVNVKERRWKNDFLKMIQLYAIYKKSTSTVMTEVS